MTLERIVLAFLITQCLQWAIVTASHPIERSMQENAWQARSVLQDTPISVDDCEAVTTIFSDPGEGANSNVLWNHTINWQRIPFTSPSNGVEATNTWFANGTASNTTAYLTSVPVTIPSDPELSTFLSFWHKYDTERGYDGCMVYYTADAGGSYHDLGPYFVEGPYNFQMITQSGAMQAFTGASGSFNRTVADLTALRGQRIQFTFILLTDFSLPSPGWWVNTIQMYTANCGDEVAQGSIVPDISFVTPSRPQDDNGVEDDDKDEKSEDTHGLAVAALVMSIVVGVALVAFIIVVASVYYADRKKPRHNDVPMVKVITHDSTAPSH